MRYGLKYSKDKSSFRVFSNAQKIELLIFEDKDSNVSCRYLMHKGQDEFFLDIHGDFKNKYYNYLVYREKEKKEIIDPYALVTTLNTKRAKIIDIKDIDIKTYDPLVNLNELIIYEAHIKDLTYSDSSKLNLKGKFLSFLEKDNFIINHLKDLGINAIHFLPLFDFETVDEITDEYNWGYDPIHYFNLEGSYSVDFENRIIEFKKMVEEFHSNGIAVIVDVVYNHTYRGEDSYLNFLYPDYYYRLNEDGSFSNGSGVGNELKSENEKVRELILDSLIYATEVLNVDGFRFDLFALTDIDTTNLIVKKLREIKPNIIIYGEPWAGSTSALKEEQMTLKGTQKDKFSLFNDDFRNAIKGYNDDDSLGWIQGDYSKLKAIKEGLIGSINSFTLSPKESVNYLSSHDNLIYYDKLVKTVKKEEIEKISLLGFSVLIFSFGTIFIQSGTEFLRTKNMNNNSYNDIKDNIIDWSFLEKNKEHYKKVKEMISIRKSLNFFKEYNSNDIREKVEFLDFNDVLIMKVNYKKYNYVFIFNSKNKDIEIDFNTDFKIIYATIDTKENIIKAKSLKIIKVMEEYKWQNIYT